MTNLQIAPSALSPTGVSIHDHGTSAHVVPPLTPAASVGGARKPARAGVTVRLAHE